MWIQNFLEFSEIEPIEPWRRAPNNTELVMALSHVTCHWNEGTKTAENKVSTSANNGKIDCETDPTRFVALSDIFLELCRNQLTCIVGTVGSGKSTLIQSLVGELPISSGTLERRYSTVAYAAQDPWIMDGTVKENILLGVELNQEWYDQVVKACGLTVDFEQFRNSDQTIVGDRGVQCSGGQRARIGIARALYRDADVLIMDDPLSAVDAKVGRLIFHEAILGLGVKRGKCVILATHQHQYIGDYRCVLMVGGRLQCIGTYADCVAASGGKLTAHAADDSVDTAAKDTKKAIRASEWCLYW